MQQVSMYTLSTCPSCKKTKKSLASTSHSTANPRTPCRKEKNMDPTTVMAVICSVIVFAGWLVLPHSAAAKPRVVSEERKPVRVSA